MKPKPKLFDPKWSFGACIQAYRYGFAPLPGYRSGLLRMSPAGDKIFCELRPLARVPLSDKGREHFVWWDKDGGTDVVLASPVLAAIKAVKKPFSVLLDVNGERVTS